ncbi:hypothetical protein GA0115255_115813, partial [Streptomyces sp. Ncost-T6T-2b]
MPGVEGGEDEVAGVLQLHLRTGEDGPQRREALVQRLVPGLDQAVGVEGEQGVLGELDLDLLERLAADAQRHPRGYV